MDNSYNLDPPKWTTHTILYRGRTSLKLYITIYINRAGLILSTPPKT